MFVISCWRVFCRNYTKYLKLYWRKSWKNIWGYIVENASIPLCLCHKFCCTAYWAPHDLLAHILFNSYLFYHHHYLHSQNTTSILFDFIRFFEESRTCRLLIRWVWSRWWYWWLRFPAIYACRAVIRKELAGQYEVEGQYWFERQWLFNLRCTDWMEWEHSWGSTV